ncbi:Phage Tail Collar Domain protein [Enhygromyxa salina]|uniref:Phage Tail Collar Domain protein n=2 Tax=Enhygromyxa salina TaxID=215803 RepID=A0A2S9XD29_9BACT|nr:Phage Tail Collar Domain protein [Enhygromyxa salina]
MAFAGQLGPPNPATASPPAGGETGEYVTNPLEAWGWMLCDGRSLSTNMYPELFVALGYLYGGSGASFRIPDYRGYFLRGTDAGAGVDKDADMRTDPAGGTSNNDGVGSIQAFAVQTHEHTYLAANSAAAPADPGTTASVPPGTKTLTTGGPTSSLTPPGDVKVSKNETRPSNIYVNYIIKFTSGVLAVPR